MLMKYKDINEKATDLIAEECIKLGLNIHIFYQVLIQSITLQMFVQLLVLESRGVE